MSGKLNQHEKEKGTYFSVVTNDANCRSNIKSCCLDFPSWAWIDHIPDDEEGSEHTHFLLRNNGTRSVKQMSDKLQIPSNFVQVVRKVTAYRRYFIHADSPEKHQYQLSDIHTNRIIDFKMALSDNVDKDVFSLYRDLEKLSLGKITPQEFVELNFIDISKVSFTQKIKIFETIYKLYNTRTQTT